ncbi:hypothetical protein PPSIR1_22421 [Plesiocystis pacifica SIR-1]|uniref:Uncharacterized protein n=1 Tax=Plesiocystis pacifica SIR-1 TaxID=391625 RepID=A6GGF6_9BACT|nr:hypothetical protein [Plesiocystis pacifica]EDM75032.1 hypothetical protein PPSIR1_22421 [Plesiocystis pacifica SIR-1]
MSRDVTFADITGAIDNRDPQLADLIVRYLNLPDPPEDRPEGAPASEAKPLGQDSWTLAKLRQTLSPYSLWGKSDDEIKAIRTEAWESLMAADNPPPRLRLGDLLIALYERGDEWGRSALIDVFRRAKMGWGIWRGFKRIYKLAEQRHDAELFGVLAWRLDVFTNKPYNYNEVSPATALYLRRRAWRYLRQLGAAVPELYPQFAVQVLRHYEAGYTPYGCWIIHQIWNHQSLVGSRSAGWYSSPPDKLSNRAFDAAWKLSAEPLLRLIEDSNNDGVLRFATRALEADFPETLREVDPAWLGRLGRKPAGSVHEFVISLLERNPEFHQSKLAGLGLHAMVLQLLGSPSEKAAKYAIEYAKNHAKGDDLSAEVLLKLLQNATSPARKFAQSRLEKLDPKRIGLVGLIALLDTSAQKFATKMLEAGFTPKDLTPALYLSLITGGWRQRQWVEKFFEKHKQKPSAALLKHVVESPQLSYWDKRRVYDQLRSRPVKEIGVEWIKAKLLDPESSDTISQWLRSGVLKKDQLDVAWLEGLVSNVRLRSTALAVLGDPAKVKPKRLRLSWLLELARHPDPELSSFARNYLLEHYAPEVFGGGDRAAGVDRLWSMAAGSDGGKAQPEAVRVFAQTYLVYHHPGIGPDKDDPLRGVLEAKLKSEDYGLDRARGLLLDPRPDVRRFAAAVAGQELVRWGDRDLVYALAASDYKEPRKIGSEVLLSIGEEHDDKPTPPVDWLIPARVFALAESAVKSSREVASALIRRHYRALGGAARLAWLMESPDREVRLFAVRLLWEQHRPETIPASWTPKKGPGVPSRAQAKVEVLASAPEGSERFETGEALRQFLRTVMFGLPPGRTERREPIAGLPKRQLAASEGKRRLVEVVRDLAVEDGEFAPIAVVVLDEFMHSQARGEWQACVAALARIRATHSGISTQLPPALSA